MKTISSKLLQDTIADAIRLWAKQQEAVDKFGDITLVEGQDDINEVARLILKNLRRIQDDKKRGIERILC